MHSPSARGIAWRVLFRCMSTMKAGTKFRVSDRIRSSDLDVLERVASARGCCRSFDSQAPVSDQLMQRILAITQRSPSGFNMQPYSVIIVDDVVAKQRLANAMLGGNPDRVLSAPLTAVFAADCEPLDHGRLERVLDSEREAGKPSQYLRNMPFDASVVIGRSSSRNPLGSALRSGVLGLGSLLMPLPVGSSSEAWAWKQAGIAAMSYMLAATAAGLGTYPMEGVDQERVRDALGLPPHFSIPIVISTGYETGTKGGRGGTRAETEVEAGMEEGGTTTAEAAASVATVTRSARLPSSYVFHRNRYDKPFHGITQM